MSPAGRTALVTGAGQGIGAAIAAMLASRGARVAVNDVNRAAGEQTVEAIRAEGGTARFFPADVSGELEVAAMVVDIVEAFGSPQILVNNAGVLSTAATEELSVQDWDRTLSVNLRGAFLCCRAVLPHMKERSWGKIVNISSLAGQSGGITVGVDYAASKGALLALTKKLALEAAPWGINVNAVAPGTTRTAMVEAMTEEQRRLLRDKIPLGRFATPQDIAHAVCFLVSDEAGFITGATLDVNGGLLMR